MSGFVATLRRELWSFWTSPAAFVSLTLFLLVQGFAFAAVTTAAAQHPELAELGLLTTYLGQSLFVPAGLLLLCPVLTMRLLAEERRSGTLELLLSAPVSTLSLVLGKLSAAWLNYAAFWLPTLVFPWLVGEGEQGGALLLVSYVTVLALGAMLLALGTLLSAVGRTPMLAAFLSGTSILTIVLLGVGEQVFEPGPVTAVCHHLSLQAQLSEGARGHLSLATLLLDASVVVFCCFLTVRVIDSWRRE